MISSRVKVRWYSDAGWLWPLFFYYLYFTVQKQKNEHKKTGCLFRKWIGILFLIAAGNEARGCAADI